MKSTYLRWWISHSLLWLGTWTAAAHVGYTNRDFGTIVPNASPVTISGQTVTGNYGWADGTDEDFGDSHHVRAFRFSLATPAYVTVTFSASTNGGTHNGTIKPGFSIFRGLAHLPPISNALGGSADYDSSPISLAYLATLGGVPKEGCFRALDTWRMGGDNQPGPTFDFDAPDGLSTFTFVAYAVDGDSSLFGSTPGIVGDGSANGTVTTSVYLEAGDYSIFVGGADYAGQSPTPDTTVYGLTGTISADPDPASTSDGIGYTRTVTVAPGDVDDFSSHVGAWSWEDNALFSPGQPPVGWTHTSNWLALNVELDSFVTLTMERDATVPWPSVALPDRLADTTSLFPSLTIYRGWDKDGEDSHTYNNRGNVSWAEDIRYLDHVDNSTQEAITRTWRLPAGRYSVALGSNAPATNPNRQGYKLTYSAAAFSEIYTGDPVSGGIGYAYVVTAGRGSSGSVSNHAGAWSWEDNALFSPGQPPVGWTHTSRWLGLLVTEPLTFTVTMAPDANVPWPSTEAPDRKASIASMFPSLTLWRGWYNHGGDHHTYNNRGDVSWAPDLQYMDHLDNSTEPTVTRSWTLTPGAYTFALGSNAAATDPDRQGFSFAWTTSTPRFQGPVITGHPRDNTVTEGKRAAFQVGAGGPEVQIQWFHDGRPIPGANQPSFVLPAVVGADGGDYVAEVRNPAGWMRSHAATLTVVEPPQLSDPGPLPGMTIGQAPNFAFGAVPNSTYVITGLPRGLRYDRQTGGITGRPIVSGTFPITVRVVNRAGSSDPVTVNLVIDSMPEGTVGTYTGIVERSPLLNDQLGGCLTITSTPLAAFSATLKLGSKTYRGRQTLTIAQDSDFPTGQVQFAVRGRPPVVVDFTLQSTSRVLEGTVSSGGGALPFTARQPVAAPADYVGDHTFALAPAGDDATNRAVPQGYSVGTLTVNSRGLSNGTLRFADNTAATFAGPVEVDGNLAVFVPLYRNGGSFLGMMVAQGGTGEGDLRLSELDWFKASLPAASRERVYKDGFGPVALETIGRRIDRTWEPLTALGLTANAAGNAELTFADGDAPDPATRLNVTVEVKAGDAQPVAVVGGNPGLVSLVTRRPFPAPGVRRGASGLCTGQFTLVDAGLTRKVAYQGIIVNDGGVPRVLGFFLLPQLPQAGPPTTTLRTSPMLSGKVLLEPIAP